MEPLKAKKFLRDDENIVSDEGNVRGAPMLDGDDIYRNSDLCAIGGFAQDVNFLLIGKSRKAPGPKNR
jgi:hypothetical protein